MQISIKKSKFIIKFIFGVTLFFNCITKYEPVGTSNGFQNSNIDIITIGGSKNESAQSITKTLDGGYAILGYTQSSDGDIENKTNESYDFWLLKYDATHTLQWQKIFGGSDDDRGSSILQTNDGGYAIFGYSQSADGDIIENAGSQDFWFSKLDNVGNRLWQKSFGYSGSDSGTSIIQTNDNGFLLIGVLDVSASGGQGNSKSTLAKRHAGGDYWIIKLNASGDKEWSRYFGGTFTDTPYDAVQTNDNGYIIVGSSDSDDVDIKNNKGSYDFWVIKISETSELVWEKSIGGTEVDEASDITKSNDGNYIIIGDSRSSDLDVSNNNGAADLWVIKISPRGDIIWEKTIGGSSFESGSSITNTNDGGFIISGNTRSSDGDITSNQGQNDALILKIDSQGNLIWEKTVGGSNSDFAHDIIELDNGTIVVVGESNSSNADIEENKGFTDALVIKITE